MTITTFFEDIINAFSEQFSWYAGFAFPFFIIFWIVGKKYFKMIRIQETEKAKFHHLVSNSDAKEKAARESSKKATGKRDKGKRKGTGSHEV